MVTTNITTFRKNIFKTLSAAIEYNESVTVNTKDGNVVVMSEADYNNLIATVELTAIPEMNNKLVAGLHTPLSECVSEDAINW